MMAYQCLNGFRRNDNRIAETLQEEILILSDPLFQPSLWILRINDSHFIFWEESPRPKVDKNVEEGLDRGRNEGLILRLWIIREYEIFQRQRSMQIMITFSSTFSRDKIPFKARSLRMLRLWASISFFDVFEERSDRNPFKKIRSKTYQ